MKDSQLLLQGYQLSSGNKVMGAVLPDGSVYLEFWNMEGKEPAHTPLKLGAEASQALYTLIPELFARGVLPENHAALVGHTRWAVIEEEVIVAEIKVGQVVQHKTARSVTWVVMEHDGDMFECRNVKVTNSGEVKVTRARFHAEEFVLQAAQT